MSAIYDIAGTSSNTFSLNGKLTFLQGDTEPEEYLGKNGDTYFQTNGNIWIKKDELWSNISSSALPTPVGTTNRLVYSNGTNYSLTSFTYDDFPLCSQNNTFTGTNTFNNIELKASTPSIDFHFNNSTSDYTSRIYESKEGVLSIKSKNDVQNGATSNMDSEEIATKGWVNNPSESTNVVHKSGNETIADTKTFTSGQKFKNNSADISKATTSNVYQFIDYLDKNNQRLGVSGGALYTDGYSGAYLQARNAGSIYVKANSSGNVITHAPTPPTSDNSTQIATTAWVNSKVNTTGKKPKYTNLISCSSPYTTPSDGLIVMYLPTRMVGSFTIGTASYSFSYSYNNTEPSLASFPVSAGQVVSFSGCSCTFYPW